MSLIAIVYKAVVFSTVLFFVMLIGSYVAYIFRRGRNKKSYEGKRNSKTVMTAKQDSMREINEIKRIHNETIAAVRSIQQNPEAYHTLRRSRYDIINNTSKKNIKKVAEENSFDASTQRFFGEKALNLDFYKNA